MFKIKRLRRPNNIQKFSLKNPQSGFEQTGPGAPFVGFKKTVAFIVIKIIILRCFRIIGIGVLYYKISKEMSSALMTGNGMKQAKNHLTDLKM